jgi:hypothetical protein
LEDLQGVAAEQPGRPDTTAVGGGQAAEVAEVERVGQRRAPPPSVLIGPDPLTTR